MTWPLREGLIRKHIHAWRKISGGVDMSGTTDRMKVVRECHDCRERQETLITWDEYNSIPLDLVHLADAQWSTVERKRGCRT